MALKVGVGGKGASDTAAGAAVSIVRADTTGW